ncbi:MAG: hypothetical protein U9O94_09670 [Nanoarchaeota archaeon]|nr:hypothetical protein [Nanoarchaeota archaeon]
MEDYTPVTFDKLKEKAKKTITLLGAPVIANLCFIPPAYNIPVAAAISVMYRTTTVEKAKG